MNQRLGLWGVTRNKVNDGYGYAGFKMTQALTELGVEVFWEDTTAPVSLSFIQPEFYGGTLKQYRIGYTPWESTIVPEEWISIINSTDEFWTTSEFCAEVFQDQGVTRPIRVVPHGIDPDEWQLVKREKNVPFVFLHQGEPADRKGSQMTFNAFKKVFAGNPDVFLVFKSSSSWVEARWLDDSGSIIGPVDRFPNVQTLKGILTLEQMNELYQTAHCMVYPSNGEGFGLIPFQAAATGMPTIAPVWGGIREFGEYITPIDYQVGPSNHGYHTGDWCWPSFDDLCEKMEDIYLNYESYVSDAVEKAVELREEFLWRNIFEPIVDDLGPLFS